MVSTKAAHVDPVVTVSMLSTFLGLRSDKGGGACLPHGRSAAIMH